MCSSHGLFRSVSRGNLGPIDGFNDEHPPHPQLNSDLRPFVKSSMGEPVLFSLFSAPVVFHRQIIGEDQWHQQLQQVFIYFSLGFSNSIDFHSFHSLIPLWLLHQGKNTEKPAGSLKSKLKAYFLFYTGRASSVSHERHTRT